MATLQQILKRRSKPQVGADVFIEELIEKRVEVLFKPIKEMLVAEGLREIKKLAGRMYKGDPGEPGKPGKDGSTPTMKELMALIEPLIPPPVKGDAPTREELVSLIVPLIPPAVKGDPGKDGSPDTGPQIAEKLNTTEDSVNLSVIRGLRAALDNLSRRGGGGKGGGGTGNVVHEHKSVSSATTSVSTASKIAGAGFAIWAYYNGQLIARGTDYTVNGDYKTLPLLFTPQDNTVIDLIYMRA